MVYVDDMFAQFGRMKMCHMIADSREELDVMADKIGVARRWIQYPGTWKEHYDVCQSMRDKAIKLGAKPVSMYSLLLITDAIKRPDVFGETWQEYLNQTTRS